MPQPPKGWYLGADGQLYPWTPEMHAQAAQTAERQATSRAAKAEAIAEARQAKRKHRQEHKDEKAAHAGEKEAEKERTKKQAHEAAAKKKAERGAAKAAAEARRKATIEASRAARRRPNGSAPAAVHGLQVIRKKRMLNLVEQHRLPGEQVEAVVHGLGSQAIVALSDRLLVVKIGPMAGTTGGGLATTYPYRDITGVQVSTGITTGVITINMPGVNTTSGGYWATHSLGHAGQKDDPFKLPNAIPTNKQLLRTYAGDLAHIQNRVSSKHSTATQPQAPPHVDAATTSNPQVPPPDLAAQLTQITELHRSGALSDNEFAAAKQRLLGG